MLIPLSDIEVKPHSHENSQPAFSFGRAGQFSLIAMMVMLIEMMLLMIVTRTILMMRGMKMVEQKSLKQTNKLILTLGGCSVLALKGCYTRIHLNNQIFVLTLLKKKFFMFAITIKRMGKVVLLDS